MLSDLHRPTLFISTLGAVADLATPVADALPAERHLPMEAVGSHIAPLCRRTAPPPGPPAVGVCNASLLSSRAPDSDMLAPRRAFSSARRS
jgi:hypothetical protein